MKFITIPLLSLFIASLLFQLGCENAAELVVPNVKIIERKVDSRLLSSTRDLSVVVRNTGADGHVVLILAQYGYMLKEVEERCFENIYLDAGEEREVKIELPNWNTSLPGYSCFIIGDRTSKDADWKNKKTRINKIRERLVEHFDIKE